MHPIAPVEASSGHVLATGAGLESQISKRPIVFKNRKETHLSADLLLRQSLRKLGSIGKDVSASTLDCLRAIAEQEAAERRSEDRYSGSRKRELRRDLRKALAALEKVDTRHGKGGHFILRLCGYSSSSGSKRRIAPEEATSGLAAAAPQPPLPGALVSACAHGVGVVRQRALCAVEHPSFDQFIMACILANCVLLAVADPTTDEETPAMATAGVFFLVIFSAEAVTKAVALGGLYSRDAWNGLDVVVVVEGWVSLQTKGGGYLAGLKTLRILRPLRVANRLPALKRMISAMLGSLPAIADSLIVLALALFLFALLCSMLWSGTFHYRCMNDATGEWVDEDNLCYPEATIASSSLCERLTVLNHPYTCESGETCTGYRGYGGNDDGYDGARGRPGEGAPESGNINFDNTMYSFLTLFAVTTMEGWSGVLYWTQDVMAEWTFFVFLAIIIVGNFTVVNLMIAAILVQLDGTTEKVKTAAAEAKAKKEAKLTSKVAFLGFSSSIDGSLVQLMGEERLVTDRNALSQMMETQMWQNGWPLRYWIGQRTLHELVDAPHDFLAGFGRATCLSCRLHCYGGFPRGQPSDHWSARARFAVLDDTAFFSKFIQACILLNLCVLALDSHNISEERASALNDANLVLTLVFASEMFIKLWVGGIPDYFLSWWNIFDGFIVTTSLVDLIYEHFVAGDGEGGSSLGALRIIRMLRLARVARVARLANKWKFLQDVIKLMISGIKGMGPVLLLLALFLFIFSILGMQMFGSLESIAEDSDGFIRFDSFFCAFVQCFFVITGEAWVDVMYTSMASAGAFSAVYFVALVVLGSFIMLNLILAVVLGGGGVSQIQFDAGLSQLDGITSSYKLRCALAHWHWFSDQKHKESLRLEAATRLQKVADRHDMRCFVHKWFYESELFAEEAADRLQADPDHASAEDKRVVLASEYARHYRDTQNEKRAKALEARARIAEVEEANLAAAEERIQFAKSTPVETQFVADYEGRNNSKSIHQRTVMTGVVDRDPLAYLQDHFSPKESQRSGKASTSKAQIGMARDIESLEHVYNSLGLTVGSWRLCWWAYRKRCCTLMASDAWHKSIMAAVVISSVTMLFPDPSSAGLHATPVFAVDMACTLLFVTEICVLLGALELPQKNLNSLAPPRTGLAVYLGEPWNCLDVGVVAASLARLAFAPGSTAFQVLTLLRAHRPLRIIKRVPALRETVYLLYSSCAHLGTLAMFLVFAMTAYAVVGMQLLKGTFGYCDDGTWAEDEIYLASVGSFPEGASRWGRLIGSASDDDAASALYVTRPCAGNFTFSEALGSGQQLEARGEWSVPTFHFDDFPNALMSVFVLCTGGWADIMWTGLAATDVDYSSEPYASSGNVLVVFYLFFGVAFFGLYYVNLFIGVVFERFTEMNSVKDDGHYVASENRDWEGWQSHLKLVRPVVALPRPMAPWRRACGVVADSEKLNNAVLFTIGLNVVALVVAQCGLSDAFTDRLEYVNCFFAAVFVLETSLKLTGHGSMAYFSSSESCFDFIVTVASMLDSALFLGGVCANVDSAALRLLRSMRVFRLVRLAGLIEGCADILLACSYAVARLAVVCLLLLILVFYFANIGKVLFADYPNHGSRYANFRSVFGAMQLLFVLMTGDAWTDTYSEMLDDAPSASARATVNVFFLVYMLTNFFVTVNLFIMVICEAFDVLSESNRRTVEKLLPIFKKAWATYDPHALGRLCLQPLLTDRKSGLGLMPGGEFIAGFGPKEALEAFVRRVPAPLGVALPNGQPSASRTTEARVRAKLNFLHARPGFEYGFQEVLLGLAALWLTEEEQVKVPGVDEQLERLAASIMIATHLKRLATRMQARRKRTGEAARADFYDSGHQFVEPFTAAPSVDVSDAGAYEADAFEELKAHCALPKVHALFLPREEAVPEKSARSATAPASAPTLASVASTPALAPTRSASIADQIKAGAEKERAKQVASYKKRAKPRSPVNKVRLAPIASASDSTRSLSNHGSLGSLGTLGGLSGSGANGGRLPLGAPKIGAASPLGKLGIGLAARELKIAAPKHEFLM